MRKLLITLLLLVATACAVERQPNADYRARRIALSKMTNGGVIVLFARREAQGPNAIWPFHQDDNFYYLTGLTEPGPALLIAPEIPANGKEPGRPYTEILFLPKRNPSQEKWTGPKLGPDDPTAARLTGFDKVESLERMRDELAALLPSPQAVVYSDLSRFSEIPKGPLEWLQRANSFPVSVEFQDVNPLLASLRTVKDADELALIKKAVDASVAAHLAVMRAVHPGTSEREIAALADYEYERRGCERPAYGPIVAAGPDSTIIHYDRDEGMVHDGDVVIVDAAGEYSYYAADITRTLPANGKFTQHQREVYEAVLGAQEAAIKAFKAGQSTLTGDSADSLYHIAMEYLNTHGSDLHGRPLGKYFLHGLGHFVGLEVHDAGDPSTPLNKGMVFTIEPGVYIAEENLGVRIEDMFYVDRDGHLVRMTSTLPRTAEEIEKAMAK
jgi:Xaa-Pro aminopeptidase